MASRFNKTDLFGGAITANIPSNFADVSNIRQVPDHQEVYLSATGFSSIIFDIAERVSHLPNDQEALIFHFNDIVTPRDESRVWRSFPVQLDNFPPTTPALTLLASTKPSTPSGRPNEPTSTTILMTLIRLVSKSTDLVITINLPHIPSEENTNAVSAASDGGLEDIDIENGRLGSFVEDGVRVRDEVLQTLTIRDWSLFGEEEHSPVNGDAVPPPINIISTPQRLVPKSIIKHTLGAFASNYAKLKHPTVIVMAIRGQRFQIDLDSDDETNAPKPTVPVNQTSPFFGLVSDVKERETFEVKAPTPPKLKSSETGFPGHGKRTRPSTFKQRRAHEAASNGANPTRTSNEHVSQPEPNDNASVTAPPTRESLENGSERQSIDAENKQRLAQMSAEDIEEARQELMDGLGPSLIEKLLKKANIDDGRTDLEQGPADGQQVEGTTQRRKSRPKRVTFEEPEPDRLSDSEFTQHPSRSENTTDSATPASKSLPQDSRPPELDPSSPNFLSELHDKYFPELPSDPATLSWMQPLPEKSSYDPSAESLPAAALRFDFRGHLLPPRLSSQLPSTLGLHHHSSAPSSAGYTIPELAHLGRSSFASQRCIAIQTLGRILYRLGRGDFGREGDDLCEGLWEQMDRGRVIDNLVEAAGGDKEKGNRTVWVTATEAVWLWRKGGGKRWRGR